MPPSHAPRTQPPAPPPPPLHARAFASPPLPSHARPSRGWRFMAFRRHSHQLHLPRMPDRARSGHSWCFRVVHTSSTSLACKSKPEVNIHGLLMPFPPPYTSLACQIEPDADVHGILALSMPLPPPSHARPNWWFHGVQWLGLVGPDMTPNVEQTHDNHPPKV